MLLLGFLVGSEISYASLSPEKALTQFIRQSWQGDAGLPEGVVQAIAQTPDGYVWFGTEEGLARFDGVRFTRFDRLNTPALRANQISALRVDHAGRLWIGTRGGGITSFADHVFQSYADLPQTAGLSILSLFEDRGHRLWAGTESSGLLSLDPERRKTKLYTKADGLPDNTVFALTGDHDGNVLVGTRKGLRTVTPSGVVMANSLGLDHDLDIRALLVSSHNELWIGTGGSGVYVKSASGLRHLGDFGGVLDKTVADMIEDGAGSIWIGSWQNGLVRITNNLVSHFGEGQGLPGNSAVALYEDRNGSLWIGGNAVTHLDEGFITPLSTTEGLRSDTVLPIFEDSSNAIWIGSNKGLTRIKNGVRSYFGVRSGLPDDEVFSLTETRGNVVWAGTRAGLARLEGNKTTVFSTSNGLPSASIFCTYADRSGRLWVGTRGGLSVLDGKRFRTFTMQDGLSNNFVTAIYEAADHTLWLGTNGGGLDTFDGSHFGHPTAAKSLAQSSIWSITGDADGTLWVGTNGSGLNRIKDNVLTAYTREQGLSDDVVFQILDDRKGNLWLTSNKGVSKVSRSDLEALAAKRLSQVRSELYGTSDGMKTHECNGGFQPAGWRMDDGKLWIPTMQGVSIVDPEGKKVAIPTAVIESVHVGSNFLPFDHSVLAPSGQRQLTVQFTAPSFSHPGAIQFRYMLSGFDKDWVQAGTQRQAIYTNLPPREYHFSVQACFDNHCGPTRSTASLTFAPAFYETNLFYGGCLLVLGAAIFAIHRVRIRHLKASEQRLLSIVEQRTSELRESRDQLEVRVEERTRELSQANTALEFEILVRREAETKAEAASRAKSLFLTNMSHELRTPINGIIGMTEIALASNQDPEQGEFLDIVKVSAYSLLEVVTDILDYSTIEAGKQNLNQKPFSFSESIDQVLQPFAEKARQKGLEFEIVIAPDIPDALIGDDAKIGQVLSCLLSNALKFTKSGFIRTAIQIASWTSTTLELQFQVQDTGIGISPQKQELIFEPFSQADYSSTRQYGGTGLGLAISNRLVAMMSGTLTLQSEPGNGSTFTFTALLLPPTPAEVGGLAPHLHEAA